MKKHIAMISLVIATIFMLPSASFAGQFTVTRVFDGDTIMAEGHDIIIYVLLAGIDAPEIDSIRHEQQPYSQEAQRYLEGEILGKVVDIKGYAIGKFPYNYLVAEIYLEGKNINIAMLTEGLAEVLREEPPEGLAITPYNEAERQTKKSRKGIWSLGKSYVSPRDWREMRGKK